MSAVLPRHVAWTVALVATLTMTVSYIDRSALAVLAPTVTKALDISDTQYGWLMSAFSIAYLVATPISGWWIDRVGARRGLVRSILVWTTVTALHALVPGFGVLFVLRIALGLAEGPSFPGAAQTMQRVLPAAEQSRGFGVLFTGSSIGGMLAPPLASYLYGISDSWRVALLGSSLVGLAWIPLWLVVTRRADVRPVLDVGTTAARSDVTTVPTATVTREPPGARPAFIDVATHPNMLRALAAIVSVAPIIGFGLMWGAKYLARVYGVEQKAVGHYLWLPPLIYDLASITFGDLASRQRRPPGAPPRLLFAIGVLLATTLVALPYATTTWQTVTLIGIAMAGGGIVYALVTSDLLSRVPPTSVSLAGGTVAGAQSLALIIANPLIGASVDHSHGFITAVTVLGIWVLPGTLYWLLRRPV